MTATENIRHLINEIEAEIEHFQQLTNDVAESTTRFLSSDQISIHDMRGIAMLLTEIYVGAENLMLRIAKSLAEPIPTGKAWHKELLEQFSIEAPDTRPPLFSPDIISQLDEFRRFRHVVHHVYSFNYDWEQMKKLLTIAGPLLTNLIEDTQAFMAFLTDVITDENNLTVR